MKITPIKTEMVHPNPKQKFSEWIEEQLKKNDEELQEGDILIITSKMVSYFENKVIDLDEVEVAEEAKEISERTQFQSDLVQVVLEEADEVIEETPWVLLTRKNGIFCANAGVDSSNVPKNHVVLWPSNPFNSAKEIQKSLQEKFSIKKLAVVITDSVCVPGRKGTMAISIGHSSIQGYEELKGSSDLFGNTLKYSALNIVDSLATAANLTMGEGKECTPMAIVRGYSWESSKETKNDEMVISPSDEMYPF